MADQWNGPGFPGPSTPPNPSVPPAGWVPTVTPPPPRAPHQRRSGAGCGITLVFLVGFVLVLSLVIGGIVMFQRKQRENDPAYQRTQRMEELRGVCGGKGVADVPAYRRGGNGQLGARVDLQDREHDRGERDIVAFTLVPGAAADPDDVVDARVMACTTSTATKTETCSFNDLSRAPNFGGGGNVTAEWTTLTSTELRIVDIHSGKVLQKSTFETPSRCPSSLRINDDGSYRPSLPLEQITAQAEAQVALFHQG